jgi:hypothetical protein
VDTLSGRAQTNFTVVPAADIDPSRVRNEWYVQHTEFGARYLDRMDLRWINLGKETPSPKPAARARRGHRGSGTTAGARSGD